MTTMSKPLILVGAGGMGRMWLQAILEEPGAELAGIVDLDIEAAQAALEAVGRPDVPTGQDAVALAEETGAEAVVNVTIPQAHHPVTVAALNAGLPVLGEKPVADTLPRALSLAAAAEATGEFFMVSQSRRYNQQLYTFRDEARILGPAGMLVCEFFRAPRFGGFRDQMAHPLLLDMAIHPFDAARFVMGTEPVSVYCEEFNPSWSWYVGDAAATAIFQMESGARFVYTGSWCSPGRETSWNGQWRLTAERGSVLWDGERAPLTDSDAPVHHTQIPGAGIAGALAEFLSALSSPTSAQAGVLGEVHQNILSLAMVEAAVESAERASRVPLEDVLERAWHQAMSEESSEAVRACLASWTSVRRALG